jgi:hypothetical protein
LVSPPNSALPELSVYPKVAIPSSVKENEITPLDIPNNPVLILS